MSNPADLKVIVAPLDWGMGHATRSIPVIRMLQQLGITVVIGGTKKTLDRIRASGIVAEWLELPSYSVYYSRIFPVWAMVLWKSFAIRNAISLENKAIWDYLKTHEVSAIISDNRYGCYHEKVSSILITHQIRPKAPFSFLQPFVNGISRTFLKNFDDCWVPDVADHDGISGELSLPFPNQSVRNIGLLSRFNHYSASPVTGENVLAIVSGPSPQSDVFTEKLIQWAISKNIKLTIITAQISEEPINSSNDLIRIVISPEDEQFKALIDEHSFIIMRSGYSSIMDLFALNRTALLVPTPGQTEQEYLAKRMKRFGFTTVSQKEIQGIEIGKSFPKINTPNFLQNDSFLKVAINNLLQKIEEKKG